MDNETYIKCDFKQLPGPKFYTSIVHGHVINKLKYKSLDKLGHQYIKEYLQARFLPFYRSHYVPCWFWPDLASCHY